ncbi:10970_t:CDS:2 [Racocetra fulgida]|uniref:10970_t:CDS:1 n=1 Tax=Racocetra fulgida TaxID=60492 RepID=A0A9N9BC91_9GLOM|nr:10970_t:CDS:2 [Racocetra fulgida]
MADSPLSPELPTLQDQEFPENSLLNQLLDIWINILSQSTHTQQLLSDPSWQGSSAETQRVLEEQAKERERQEKLTRLQQERLETHEI